MKFNTQILILVLLLCLSSGACLASDVLNAQPFVTFALDSKLGTPLAREPIGCHYDNEPSTSTPKIPE